jgi:hypothetical protein
VVAELARAGVKLIAMRCAGYDRVDLAACAEAGIRVVRVPTYSPQSVAEHAVALMFGLNRCGARLGLAGRGGQQVAMMHACVDGLGVRLPSWTCMYAAPSTPLVMSAVGSAGCRLYAMMTAHAAPTSHKAHLVTCWAAAAFAWSRASACCTWHLAHVLSVTGHSHAHLLIPPRLAWFRSLHQAHTRVNQGNYGLDGLVGSEMWKKTVGVVGTGAIGVEASRIIQVRSAGGSMARCLAAVDHYAVHAGRRFHACSTP